MMEFYSENCYTARKEHTCEMCGGIIHIGEKYYQESGKWEGEFFSRSLHVHCHKMEREYCVEVDNEFTWDGIMDYIRDKYCNCCEHADCNEDKVGWTECKYAVTSCPKILKIFERLKEHE